MTFAFVLGCGSSAESGDTGGAGTGGAGGDVNGSQWFAVTTQIAGDAPVTLVGLVNSLGEDVTLDPATAIEAGQRGFGFGPEGEGTLFVLDGESAQITRFDIDPLGVPRQGEILSAQNLLQTARGATAGNFAFIDSNKAYAIDPLNQQIIIWDPEAMVLIEVVDVSDAMALPEFAPVLGYNTQRRGNELVIVMGYRRLTTIDYATESRIIFFDTDTDAVIDTTVVEDCALLQHTFETEDGDIYAASDVFTAIARLTGTAGGPECFVRVPAGAYSTDSYTLFSSRTTSAAAGSILQQSGTRAYIRVLDEALVPEGMLTSGELNGTPAWRWGLLDLATSDQATVLTDREPQAAVAQPFIIGGAFYSNEFDDFDRSRVVSLSGADGPTPGVNSVGIIRNVFRVR
ncbi:MAG: hypothetical protein AAF500_19150 [Myxococcota bacterium]